MNQKLILRLTLVVCLVAVTSALSGDGSVPIWEPTTITQPGKYVVTRNITHGATVLSIQSDDVIVDLNGFCLENTGTGGTIDLPSSVSPENVEIANGTIRSADVGINVHQVSGLVVERTKIKTAGYGVFIAEPSDGSVIVHNRIDSGAVPLNLDCSVCDISHNTVQMSDGAVTNCMHLEGSGSQIRENEMTGCAGNGLNVTGDANRVVGNVVQGTNVSYYGMLLAGNQYHVEGNTVGCPGDYYTVGMSINGDGATVRGNTVGGCSAGIRISGNDCLVRDNAVSCFQSSGGHEGLTVSRSRNHLEGNLVTRCEYGILLEVGSTDNVYRGNTARGNETDFVDDGSGNTSHRDNYMPNKL